MTYIAYPAAGDLEEGLAFLEYLRDLLPAFRKFARDFYGAPGAAVPGVMSHAGKPLGGWGHYSLSPAMGAWCGHLFYLHWRYTADPGFLREVAYPWCREVGECLRHLLRPGADGILRLPVSTSPEIHDNSARAWLRPNTNYDLACLKMLFLALADMARAAGDAGPAGDWADLARRLGPFHAGEGGALLLAEGEELRESHRHLSNLIGIHPFNLITVEGGEGDRRTIDASLRQWERLGTGAWCGYSFSWMACLRARVGDAEGALRNLDIFVKAFILRNGFHANGDQTGSGFSGFTYRPFTLEGNFLAQQAVQEMLLQSWSPRPGTGEPGTIRVFPAAPWRWHEASFEDLRAEGGHRVSARRERNGTTWLRVVAGPESPVRIRDGFGGREVRWSRGGVRKEGRDFVVELKPGETIEGTLPPPDRIPDPPADLARPVAIEPPGAIRVNPLPLRIGADSSGGTRFIGDIGRASVFDRALAPAEVKALAARKAGTVADVAGCVASLAFGDATGPEIPAAGSGKLSARIIGTAATAGAEGFGKVLRLDGGGHVEVPHSAALDCAGGLTLEAWIRPLRFPASGMRIIDKTPVGVATAYGLDTHPGDSLRFMTRDPHLVFPARLRPVAWTHVAATADPSTGARALYVNGERVAGSP